MTISIPLSQIGGDPKAFAVALEAHRADLEAHRSGPHGRPAPISVLDDLIERVPRGDPLPDAFVVRAYEIVDDTPRSEEEQRALDVLRETLGGANG